MNGSRVRSLLIVAIALTLPACDTSTDRSSTPAIGEEVRGAAATEPNSGSPDDDSKCVDVNAALSAGGSTVTQPDGSVTKIVEASSGDFTVGNFQFLEQMDQFAAADFYAKLYWIPAGGDVARTESLRITNRFLDDPTESLIMLNLGGDGTWSKTAGGVYFWPSQVPFHRTGRWRLTATAAGLDSGCFDVQLSG